MEPDQFDSKPLQNDHLSENYDAFRSMTRSKSEMHVPNSKLLPNGRSLENLNGKVIHTAPPTRSSSWIKRPILLEEVVPLRTTLRDEDRKNSTGWQMSLNIFTSKRRGKREEDKSLPKSIRRYYKQQDELISTFEGAQDDKPAEEEEEIADTAKNLMKRAAILAKVSFAANLVLLIAKAVAAALSGSLSIITSVIDSVVDLVSGTLMWWSNRAMRKHDPYLYPQGRTKLEPIAIVVLSVVMSLASVAMIRQSIEKIISYSQFDLQNPEYHNETAIFCVTIIEMYDYVHVDGRSGPEFGIESIVICAGTIVIKLILFLVCRRTNTPSTQALAQDHRNDVISNAGALACGLIGAWVFKYADPIGAIIISLYIMISWFKTGNEQIKLLTGHTARPDFLKKLTWITLNHHAKVTHIDTIRAFHFGNNFLVEVDIVLPAEMSMKEAHDIGAALQSKLEKLEEVERAFVHLDYESDHHPSSEHKNV